MTGVTMFGQKIKVNENLSCSLSRFREIFDKIPLVGHYHNELWRPIALTGTPINRCFNKSGELFDNFRIRINNESEEILELIDVQDILNDITTTAKNTLFDTMFNAATQTAAANWCAGLINAAGFTGYTVATDTMASHPGWTEWTSYSQTTRVAWGQGTTASATITNATPMQFDINATGTVQGLFLTTNNTKGGTTGLLWSGASYTTPPPVTSGDQIRSTYSLSC